MSQRKFLGKVAVKDAALNLNDQFVKHYRYITLPRTCWCKLQPYHNIPQFLSSSDASDHLDIPQKKSSTELPVRLILRQLWCYHFPLRCSVLTPQLQQALRMNWQAILAKEAGRLTADLLLLLLQIKSPVSSQVFQIFCFGLFSPCTHPQVTYFGNLSFFAPILRVLTKQEHPTFRLSKPSRVSSPSPFLSLRNTFYLNPQCTHF